MIELADYVSVTDAMSRKMKTARKEATGTKKQRDHHVLRQAMLIVLAWERGTTASLVHQSARDFQSRQYVKPEQYEKPKNGRVAA